jgi:metal-responsive CopG/Arc/MetJ family transcriptional regulator
VGETKPEKGEGYYRIINIRLPQQLYEMLEKHCNQTGLKRSEVVRQALLEYLKIRV